MRCPAVLALVLLLAPLMAGCTNDAGGQSASHDGNLSYNGASGGSHSSTFDCDGSGSVQWSANLGSGGVTITVRDAAGSQAYSSSHSSVGQTSKSGDLSGAPGEWTITASRAGGFTGQYTAHASC